MCCIPHGDSKIAALKKLPALFGGEEGQRLRSCIPASALTRFSRSEEAYQDISKVIGTGRLTVDLGMVNNADYYTGVIIKGYLEGYGEEVLSGGRYNKLLADFGCDIPQPASQISVDAV